MSFSIDWPIGSNKEEWLLILFTNGYHRFNYCSVSNKWNLHQHGCLSKGSDVCFVMLEAGFAKFQAAIYAACDDWKRNNPLPTMSDRHLLSHDDIVNGSEVQALDTNKISKRTFECTKVSSRISRAYTYQLLNPVFL